AQKEEKTVDAPVEEPKAEPVEAQVEEPKADLDDASKQQVDDKPGELQSTQPENQAKEEAGA
ncbi:MAG: hypothetical protein KKD39_06075, partial [Candidatus Altiarchaeota archaeon]|nr:hypothetical protein [Candidatus Altiarchaeota archaeon]